MSTRAPPFRISGSSAACSSPSTVRSTTNADCAERAHHRAEVLDRVARAGRPDRHRRREPAGSARPRGTARAPSRASASSASCDVHRARLGLGQDRRRVAGGDAAATEHLGEGSRSTSLRFARAARVANSERAWYPNSPGGLARDVLPRRPTPPCVRRRKCTNGGFRRVRRALRRASTGVLGTSERGARILS